MDNFWDILRTIVLIISLALNILQFLLNRKIRKLECFYKIEPFEEIYMKFFSYLPEAEAAPHISKYSITIRNVGNVDLSCDDYEAPMDFTFSTEVQHINTTISKPSIIGNELQKEIDKISIEPFLLKKGEDVEISGFVQADTSIDSMDHRLRINDFSINYSSNETNYVRSRSKRSQYLISIFSIISTIVVFLFTFFLPDFVLDKDSMPLLLATLGILIISVMSILPALIKKFEE